MLHIRHQMMALSLAPDCKLEDGNRFKYLEHNSKEFKNRFPLPYKFEKKRNNENDSIIPVNYLDDGWIYDNINYKDSDWMIKCSKGLTHYYYNELDHLLSYLVGRLYCKGKWGAREPGLIILIYEIHGYFI